MARTAYTYNLTDTSDDYLCEECLKLEVNEDSGVTETCEGIEKFSDTQFKVWLENAIDPQTPLNTVVAAHVGNHYHHDVGPGVALAKKSTAGTISKLEAVYGTAVTSGYYIVEKAKSDAKTTMPSVGIAAGTITDSAEGKIITSGLLDRIDTSSWSVGDELYVSKATAGGLTNVKPLGAAKLEKVAQVLKSHATEGAIHVYNAGAATQEVYDAIVAPSGGDYALPSAAFAAGCKSVFVKNGTYVETADIEIPEEGLLTGESTGGVKITAYGGVHSIIIDGSGRSISSGTIAVTNNSTAVVGTSTTFTTLQANDYLQVNGTWLRIGTVTDNTNIVLEHPYQGATDSGLACVGQSMLVGAQISNIIFNGSIDYGLHLKNVFHAVLRDTLIQDCGASTTLPAVLIEESSEIQCIAFLSEMSNDKGVHLKNSTDVIMQACSVKGAKDNGLHVDGCENVIIDASFYLQNGGIGVEATGNSKRVHLTDSHCSFNSGRGIHSASGSDVCVIDSCTVKSNGAAGIDFDGSENIVSDCYSGYNGAAGISGGDDGVVNGNQVHNNTTMGINCTSDSNCVIANNLVYDNTTKGIKVGPDNTVTGNVVYGNTDEGILVPEDGDDCVISGNRVKGNGEGLEIASGATDCIVVGNNLKGNTANNLLDNGTGTINEHNKTS